MSDTDGAEQSKQGEDAPEYAAPIAAVPPRVIVQEESQMEVSASPAFQCLDDVSGSCSFTSSNLS